MPTTHLAVVARTLGVPLETLGQWQVYRPSAFYHRSGSYDKDAITQAGMDWQNRRPYEVVGLVNRLERAAAVALNHGDLYGDVAAHFRRITPTVIELATGEQTPKHLSTLRAVVEGAIARCRAAGLDVDNVGVPVPTVPLPPAPRFAAALDAEL